MARAASYVGRFAPSPTGRLHMGSLIAALASYAQARQQRGRWLLRMEDIDPPRERPGAAEAIEADLKRFGMSPDEPTLFQSTRTAAYQQALDQMKASGHVFPCGCSRRHLGHGHLYPQTCSGGLPPGRERRSWRVRVSGRYGFDDLLQGAYGQQLETEVGAFILWRADGQPAYQLAVVVDDHFQGITEVVRGSDLIGSTPRQLFLQRLLGLPQPAYLHLPVALNEQGNKLSKQTGARPIDPQQPMPALARAWSFLGQEKPPAEALTSPEAFWRWAPARWTIKLIPAVTEIPENRL
ncbi:MAG: tRNA glutamyl-Q(34) synthetase GluQRS [Pseudomonadota bacterium]